MLRSNISGPGGTGGASATAEQQLQTAQTLLASLVDKEETPDSDKTLVLDESSDVTAGGFTARDTRYRILDENDNGAASTEQQYEPQEHTPVGLDPLQCSVGCYCKALSSYETVREDRSERQT
ncbi:hypothetical protein RI054_16g76630 [Pseudoscourfieldia marina]